MIKSKPKFTPYVPPDATKLYMDITKKIINTENPKFIILKTFKKYKTSLSIDVLGAYSSPDPIPVQEEHSLWTVAKLYIPIDSNLKTFKQSKNETLKNRVGIELPEEATIEVEFFGLYPDSVKKKAVEQVNKTALSWFNFRSDESSINKVFLLTEKNYEITNKDPVNGLKVSFEDVPF